jgi:hypothetical protein
MFAEEIVEQLPGVQRQSWILVTDTDVHARGAFGKQPAVVGASDASKIIST